MPFDPETVSCKSCRASKIESYSVNMGMNVVSTAHFDINTVLNIVCMQIEYKGSERKGKNRSADLTHHTPT